MKRSAIETLLGAFVLAVAGFFLVFSYQTAKVGSMNGYTVTADFSGIGGLKSGDDVLISGVKVGSITAVELLPDSFLARVFMDVDSSIQLPMDTAALISSESLLGGRYLALEPGADEKMIEEGGHVQFTQAPQNLEQLLGQFIFSMNGAKDKDKAGDAEEVEAPEVISPRVEDAPSNNSQPEPATEQGAEQPAHP
jgi:phospholipid/cholesterol/gamma-HCH transport system substrate-binding protein